MFGCALHSCDLATIQSVDAHYTPATSLLYHVWVHITLKQPCYYSMLVCAMHSSNLAIIPCLSAHYNHATSLLIQVFTLHSPKTCNLSKKSKYAHYNSCNLTTYPSEHIPLLQPCNQLAFATNQSIYITLMHSRSKATNPSQCVIQILCICTVLGVCMHIIHPLNLSQKLSSLKSFNFVCNV